MTIQDNISMTSGPYPYVAICDVPDCQFRLAAVTLFEAEAELDTHKCPMEPKRSYLLEDVDERGQRYSAPHMGKSIAEKLWDALDAYLAELLKVKATKVDSSATMHQRDEQVAMVQGKCQGLAYGIHLMMPHYYPSVDDVTRQAVLRGKMKRGEIEHKPTPGYMFNPPPPDSAAAQKYAEKMKTEIAPPKQSKATQPKTKQAATLHNLTTEEVNALKTAYATNMIEPSALASAYKISVGTLESIVGN